MIVRRVAALAAEPPPAAYRDVVRGSETVRGPRSVRHLAAVVAAVVLVSACTPDQAATSATSAQPVTTSTTSISTTTPATTLTSTSVAPLPFQSVADRLDQARADWRAAGIDSYQVTVTEHASYWSAGCAWTTAVNGVLVIEHDVIATAPDRDPVACEHSPKWTVEQLYGMIASQLTEVRRETDEMFGAHTLNVQFDEHGVPVAIDYDVANMEDEESSLTVEFTPLP